MNIAPRLAAIALLVGCAGPADDPAPVTPEPPDAPRADPTPAQDHGSAEPPAGWNPAQPRLETQLPWRPPATIGGPDGGPGWAWTWTYGPSPRDWPGVAALLGAASDPLATLTWASEEEACGSDRPAALRSTGGSADGLLKTGAAVTFVEHPRKAILLSLSSAAASQRLAVRGGLTVEPDLAALWPASAGAHLVRWTRPPAEPARRLLHRVLRRMGQRPVLVRPENGWTDDALVSALLDGAVLETEAPLTGRQRRLVERVRAEPGWFGGRHPTVELIVPAAAVVRGDDDARALLRWLEAAAAALDASHLAWSVGLLGDGEALPWVGLPRSPSGVMGLLVPPLNHLSDAELELVAARGDGISLLTEEGLPAWWPEAPPQGGPQRLDDLTGEAILAAVRATLARPGRERDRGLVELDRSGLPAQTRLDRHARPGDGRLVFHLHGPVPDGTTITVRRGMDRGDAGCSARVIDAWTGEERAATCALRPGLDPWAQVVLPESSGWTVLVVERRPAPLEVGRGAWSFESAPPRSVEGRVVTFVPPADSTLSPLNVSIPEWLKAREHVDQHDFEQTLAFADEGRNLVVDAVGPSLRFRTELTGRRAGVDLEITLENVGPDPIHDVHLLLCASRAHQDQPWPFPTEGQDRVTAEFGGQRHALVEAKAESGDARYLELLGATRPVTALAAVGGTHTLSLGMDRSDRVGGNANRGICMHARPNFGDLGPGQSRTVNGRFRVEEGESSLFDLDWERVDVGSGAKIGGDDGWRLPCSEEGTQRRQDLITPTPVAPP